MNKEVSKIPVCHICPTCHGTGEVFAPISERYHDWGMYIKCKACDGVGWFKAEVD